MMGVSCDLLLARPYAGIQGMPFQGMLGGQTAQLTWQSLCFILDDPLRRMVQTAFCQIMKYGFKIVLYWFYTVLCCFIRFILFCTGFRLFTLILYGLHCLSCFVLVLSCIGFIILVVSINTT